MVQFNFQYSAILILQRIKQYKYVSINLPVKDDQKNMYSITL